MTFKVITFSHFSLYIVYVGRRQKGPQGWSKVNNPSKGLIG